MSPVPPRDSAGAGGGSPLAAHSAQPARSIAGRTGISAGPARLARVWSNFPRGWRWIPQPVRELLLWLPCLVALFLACGSLTTTIDLTRHKTQTVEPALLAACGQLPAAVQMTILAPTEPRSVGEHAFAAAVGPLQDVIARCQAAGAPVTLRSADWKTDLALRELLDRHPEVPVPGVLLQMEHEGEPRLQSLGLADLAQLGRGSEGQTVLESYAQSALHLAFTRLVSQRGAQRLGWVQGTGGRHAGEQSATGLNARGLSAGGLNPQGQELSDRQGGGVLAARLQSAGYTIEPLDLSQPPGDRPRPSVWLVTSGGQAWTTAEIDQLRQHLRTGGRAMILVERQRRGPLLGQHNDGQHNDGQHDDGQHDAWQPLWTELGLSVGADRVVALDHRNAVVPMVATQPPRAASTTAARQSPAARSTLPATLCTPIAGTGATGGTAGAASVTVFEAVSVRSLLKLDESGAVATPLLCSDSAPRAWAESDLTAEPRFDPANDLPGPVCVAMAVERAQAGRHDPMGVVVGDAELLSNSVLTSPTGHAGFAWTVACLDWLSAENGAASPIPPQLFTPIARPSSPSGPRRALWTFGLVWGAACLSFAAARSRC